LQHIASATQQKHSALQSLKPATQLKASATQHIASATQKCLQVHSYEILKAQKLSLFNLFRLIDFSTIWQFLDPENAIFWQPRDTESAIKGLFIVVTTVSYLVLAYIVDESHILWLSSSSSKFKPEPLDKTGSA
jgi:hypothetical protein